MSSTTLKTAIKREIQPIDKGSGIKDIGILNFTNLALDSIPDILFETPASTSGNFHKGESNGQHILKAIWYGKEVVKQMNTLKFWNDIATESCFISALALHDTLKYGLPGREYKYDEEACNKMSRPDLLGKLKTDPLHPIYPEFYYADITVGDTKAKTHSWYKRIMSAIRYHMGPWGPTDLEDWKKFNITDLEYQVHNVDFMTSLRI
jgi:hypothetical protein